MKEEVNIEIKDIGYVTSMVYVRPDVIPCIIVSLHAKPKDDFNLKLCNALSDSAWVSLEESKNYDLIEGIYEELEMLDKKLKGEDVNLWKKSK